MRWTLSLVPLLMLSGCLGSATDPADGSQTTSSDEYGQDTDGLREGVVFYDEPYRALPNEPLEFTVHVPEGARDVKVEMSVSGSPTPVDEAVVSLSGCGQGALSWSPGANVIVSISVMGGSWREADLCGVAEAGLRTINVDTGLTPMTGRLLLRADLP